VDDICASVEAYYSAKLARHGANALGVDWTCAATQWLRFVQLLKVCSFDAPFSLNDLGCGYGALATFLAERYPVAVDYLGIDLSRVMVQRARRRHRGDRTTRFAVGRTCPRLADYTVASGVMNVTLGVTVPLWEEYVRYLLADMHRNTRRGFAVNFLVAPTPGAPADQLYCPRPELWRQYCLEAFGGSVELLDDYGLREFTLLVRQS
jgi:SAM-dependent methyltransferase